MGVYQKSIAIETRKMYDFVKFTDKVQKIIDEAKIENGIAIVNTQHTTAAVIIQENDRELHNDIASALERLVPLDEDYEHVEEGKENAAAHIKSTLLGPSKSVSIVNGKLDLGTWQDIFFLELLEPRHRKVLVTVIGE